MGWLDNGVWKDEWYDTKSSGGRFKRKESSFRNWISSNEGATFQAERGRYHLIVAMACPWAHRTLIFRKLKALENIVTVSHVLPLMQENGWTFASPEPETGANFLWQVYIKAKPSYSGRATVPILWDKKTQAIVSNESSEIIRMFNSAFNKITGDTQDFYPTHLRKEIDDVNAFVYTAVNNGVYKAGFATTQEAYEEAARALFDALDQLEKRLTSSRYLTGAQITEADWRLFTTLVRFDAVYVGHFKCNMRRIEDYPNLSNYLRELYQTPGVAETVDMAQIKTHYYGSHHTINPTGVIPIGPELNFNTPHNRDQPETA